MTLSKKTYRYLAAFTTGQGIAWGCAMYLISILTEPLLTTDALVTADRIFMVGVTAFSYGLLIAGFLLVVLQTLFFEIPYYDTGRAIRALLKGNFWYGRTAIVYHLNFMLSQKRYKRDKHNVVANPRESEEAEYELMRLITKLLNHLAWILDTAEQVGSTVAQDTKREVFQHSNSLISMMRQTTLILSTPISPLQQGRTKALHAELIPLAEFLSRAVTAIEQEAQASQHRQGDQQMREGTPMEQGMFSGLEGSVENNKVGK